MPKKKPPSVPVRPKKEGSTVDEDVLPELKRMKELHLQLADQVIQAECKLGVDRTDVLNAVEGLKKASPDNWQKHEEKKEELERMILGEKEAKQKKLKKQERMRKGKAIGARKRWLDMR